MISLVKFAEERNEKADTIRKYINRHTDIADHTTFKDKKMMLDDEAVRMLDEIYPLPKPIEIIEDKESRLELIKTQKLVIQLQNQLMEAQGKLAKAEAMELLLEDKEKQIDKLQKDCRYYEDVADGQAKALDEAEQARKEIATELEEVRSMGIFQFMKYRKRNSTESRKSSR